MSNLSNFAELKAFALKIEDKIEFLLSVPLFQRLPQASSGKQTFRAKFYGQKKKEEIKRPWTTWTTLFNSEDIGPIGSHDRHEPVESIWCDNEKGTKMIQTVFDCRGLTVDCDGPRTVEF